MHIRSVSPTTDKPTVRDLRLWPAFAVILLQYAIMFVPQLWAQLALNQQAGQSDVAVQAELLDNPQTVLNSKLLGPAIGTLLLLLWWLLLSKAPWPARLVLPIVCWGLGWLAWQFTDTTMVFAFFMFVIPCATTSGVVSLQLLKNMSFPKRVFIATAVMALTLLTWLQFRMQGVDGDLNSAFAWRWGRTDEEVFLSQMKSASESPELPATITVSEFDSPEFGGVHRDGIIRGESIRRDWPETGLPEVWRRRIGPGWSSFAVVGDWLFTQEQRGEAEVVSAYSALTGNERWQHRHLNRFTESISGVGPRATPTFADGRIFATGPSGSVQCLEATTGELVWRRELVDDTNASVPMWGFSSSPLVVGNQVIVFAGGGSDQALIAYDRDSGEPLWQAGDGYLSYSSPQHEILHGTSQVLMMTEQGLASYATATGETLWVHDWELGGGSARIVQPIVIGNDVVIGTGYGIGTRRISVVCKGDQWSTEEQWTSRALKPYFNNFVCTENHIYGFDKNIFTCVDLSNGNRMWKRGRFGHGQVLLIENDKRLLVMSETGEVILLQANPDELEVLHRFPALDGKTWNHPVIANGKLFVRNSVEAACFDISANDPQGN